MWAKPSKLNTSITVVQTSNLCRASIAALPSSSRKTTQCQSHRAVIGRAVGSPCPNCPRLVAVRKEGVTTVAIMEGRTLPIQGATPHSRRWCHLNRNAHMITELLKKKEGWTCNSFNRRKMNNQLQSMSTVKGLQRRCKICKSLTQLMANRCSNIRLIAISLRVSIIWRRRAWHRIRARKSS